MKLKDCKEAFKIVDGLFLELTKDKNLGEVIIHDAKIRLLTMKYILKLQSMGKVGHSAMIFARMFAWFDVYPKELEPVYKGLAKEFAL